MYSFDEVKEFDPEVAEAIKLEVGRQNDHIELIASENFVSKAVMAAMGSWLTNKYAEGYPGHRYYGGCFAVDVTEELARQRACQLFGCKYANVQPHSGANANLAAFFALAQPGDTILGMNLAHGGHLSHGSPVNISGKYFHIVPYGLGEDETIVETIPADPNVRNFSYTVVDGELYYRQNSIMTKPDFNATAKERAKGMVELRDCVQKLISEQMDGFISDETIRQTQAELNTLYDGFTAKYGLINSRANALAFAEDSSYYLLCSLENLDENKNLKSKADMFTKRTIRPERVVTSVDTPSEALAVSIGEHGKVDLPYMAELLGTPGDYGRITTELSGVIFKDPAADPTDPEAGWQMADEYLSGDVRAKLRMAQFAAETNPEFAVNAVSYTHLTLPTKLEV